MLRYIKVCPRCGFHNDEFAEACARDKEFLGMVPATPADAAPPPICDEAATASAPPAPNGILQDAPAVRAMPESHPRLYVEVAATGQCFEPCPGNVIGQAHPASQANIQLQGIPGINYVHRRHCSFDFSNGRWMVTAIGQADYTNPTFHNERRVEPGQSVPLADGDRLKLSGVLLHVRILNMP